MAQPPGKLLDTIRRPIAAASSLNHLAAKHLVTLAQRNRVNRRCLLTLLASAAAIPEASESRKALLQDYVKRSKENKEKNDKERMDDVYRRNYKDYFGFMEDQVREKPAEQLTESEKGILAWLDKNK